MHNLKNLNIWKKTMSLATKVYQITTELPHNEKFGLSTQMKRSATSIVSNIAEGAGRNSKKEFKHFLSIANGSCYELQTQIQLVENLDLINKKNTKPLIDLIIEIQKMNYALQNSL